MSHDALMRLLPWRLRSFNNLVMASPNLFFRGVSRTPPMPVPPEAAIEVHALICRRDLNMMITSAKSLLRFCPPAALVLHDDGSISDEDAATLHHHFPGLRFVPRAVADAALREALPADVFALRQRHFFLLKLLDVSHFARGTHTILLDSDIVFLKPPREVIEWMRSSAPPPFYNRDPMPTYRAAVQLPGASPPTHLNAGFMGFSGRLPLAHIIEVARALDYWLEDQTLYAALLADAAPQALSPERYRVYLGEPLTNETVMVHFISPKRFERLRYPRLARRVHKELSQST